MKILSGSAHPSLARQVARELKTELVPAAIKSFPNAEKKIQISARVKNETVFIIQPTIKDKDIIELALLADAARRKGAKKIIAVTPWFAYSPQDKVYRPGEPFSVNLMIKILETSGINRFILLDFHSEKSLLLFKQPPNHQSASQLFVDYLQKRNLVDFVVVCLDRGDWPRSKKFSSGLKKPVLVLEKTLRNRETGQVEFLGLKGQIDAKNILFFDDFVSTGQTLIKAAKFLKKEGARKIIACVTHYLPVKGLSARLAASPLDEILVTDSLPINRRQQFKKLKIISLAPLLAKSIKEMVK